MSTVDGIQNKKITSFSEHAMRDANETKGGEAEDRIAPCHDFSDIFRRNQNLRDSYKIDDDEIANGGYLVASLADFLRK